MTSMKADFYSQKKLAQCFITKWSSQISIPPRIFNELKNKSKNIVAVIPGGSKKFTFFYTDASQILSVKLILDNASLNEKFFTSLRQTLKELKISNLFSTGICFKDDVCVWEGVFEFDNDENFEEIRKKLSSVTHVNKSKFNKIVVDDQ
ncbi:MAG: hypothetical protein ACTSVU_02575 [Promethearchaeota archaeon]